MNDAGSAILELAGVTALLLLCVVLVAEIAAFATFRTLVQHAADTAVRVAAVDGTASPRVAGVARATLQGRAGVGDVRVVAVDRGATVDVTVSADTPAVLSVVGTVTATATRVDERDVTP